MILTKINLKPNKFMIKKEN